MSFAKGVSCHAAETVGRPDDTVDVCLPAGRAFFSA